MTFRWSQSNSGRRKRWIALAVAAAIPAAAAAIPSSALAVGETVQAWQTGSSGAGLTAQSNLTLAAVSRGTVNVDVDDSRSLQTVAAGFGASFTDSSAYVLAQMKTSNPTAYATLMNKIFAKTASDGIGLTYFRVPMTSSDFTAATTHWTSRDTTGAFALTSQDTGRIIPVIKDALAINPNLRLIASPWSAPGWMKSNGSIICDNGSGPSTLSSSHYQDWANYFVSWINAYQANGISIYAVTPQNEPGYCPNNYPGMTWTAAAENSWVSTYLKPTLTTAGLNQKILGFDHNWEFLDFPLAQLSGTGSSSFDGMAFHCYDTASDPAAMTKVHNLYPTKAISETECSSDTIPTDIIKYSTPEMALQSVQNWADGAITWNLALDENAGPTLGGCTGCQGLITINSSTHAATLRNNYYQLGQLSKFVTVGATHIGSTVDAHGIVAAAFKNPDGKEVLVATNRNATSTTFTTTWNGKGSFSYTLPSRATVTFTGTIGAATVLPATPANGRRFKILSRTAGKPFGISGGSTADAAKVVQWTDDDDYDQQWTLVDAGSGYYNLINRNSGKALDNPSGSTVDGTQMQQYTITGTGNANQQWQVTAASTGYYRIVNRTSGKSLDVKDGTVTDDTFIQQYTTTTGNTNQEFQLVPVG
jgi:glucosylceramidase